MEKNFCYALRLERQFNKLLGEGYVQQDAFTFRLTDAIQEGLGRLNIQHIIKDETFSEMCREYDFGDARLVDVVKDETNTEKLDHLLDFLEETWKYEQRLNEEEK